MLETRFYNENVIALKKQKTDVWTVVCLYSK